MIAKKIGLHEWNFISTRDIEAEWIRPFCNYYLIKKDEDTILCMVKIKLPFYLLVFIPAHIYEFIHCAFDGGLKYFQIIPQVIGYFHLYNDKDYFGADAYERALKIFNKH